MRTTTAALLLSGAGFLLTGHAAEGYLSDSGGTPVTSGTALCWRTGSWTPAHASADCDAELVRAHHEAVRVTVTIPAPPLRAPAAPTLVRRTIEADPLFDFDSAHLRDTGKAKLDTLAAHLLAAGTIDHIAVTGHADRLGSTAYNQRLSEQRAAAVREHLVSAGVPAERIHAEGRGEKEPVTGADTCPDTKRTSVLIACLQPDRRVEVMARMALLTH